MAKPMKLRKLNCLDMCGNTLNTFQEITGGICLKCLRETNSIPSVEVLYELKLLTASLH